MSRLFCGHAESVWMQRIRAALWFLSWVCVGLTAGAVITAFIP